jgi:glycerol-3-phosphate dehydrogenase subunit B
MVSSMLEPAATVELVEVDFNVGGVDSPTGLLQWLDRGPSADGSAEFTEAFVQSGLQTEAKALLVPPIFGRRFHTASAWCKHLSEATGKAVVERPPLDEPILGLRMWRFLQQALTDAGVEVIRGRALDLRARGDKSISALEFDVARGRRTIDDVAAVVLASGRLTGGGVSASAPLQETVFGLPVRLDGVTITRSVQTADLVGLRPWSDHPMMRVGVTVDDQLRPLGLDNAPAWANLYAAGRLLGGTNPAVDGSAQGVDLVTGRLAGLAAAAKGGR